MSVTVSASISAAVLPVRLKTILRGASETKLSWLLIITIVAKTVVTLI